MDLVPNTNVVASISRTLKKIKHFQKTGTSAMLFTGVLIGEGKLYLVVNRVIIRTRLVSIEGRPN